MVLQVYPKHLFDNLLVVEIIRLNNNKISYLSQGLFSKLQNLTYLCLSHNNITTLEKYTFFVYFATKFFEIE